MNQGKNKNHNQKQMKSEKDQINNVTGSVPSNESNQHQTSFNQDDSQTLPTNKNLVSDPSSGDTYTTSGKGNVDGSSNKLNQQSKSTLEIYSQALPKKKILILGPSGAGKSSFINLVYVSQQKDLNEVSSCPIKTKYLNGDASNINKIGHYGTESVTVNVQPYDLKYQDENGTNDLNLQLIDTPGFLDTKGSDCDFKILNKIRDYCSHNDFDWILVILDLMTLKSNDENSTYITNMLNEIIGIQECKSHIYYLITKCSDLSNEDRTTLENRFGMDITFTFFDNLIFDEDWSAITEQKVWKRLDKQFLLLKTQLKKIMTYFQTKQQFSPMLKKNFQKNFNLINTFRCSIECLFKKEDINLNLNNEDKKWLKNSLFELLDFNKNINVFAIFEDISRKYSKETNYEIRRFEVKRFLDQSLKNRIIFQKLFKLDISQPADNLKKMKKFLKTFLNILKNHPKKNDKEKCEELRNEIKKELEENPQNTAVIPKEIFEELDRLENLNKGSQINKSLQNCFEKMESGTKY